MSCRVLVEFSRLCFYSCLFPGINGHKKYVIDKSCARFGNIGVCSSYDWCILLDNSLWRGTNVRECEDVFLE